MRVPYKFDSWESLYREKPEHQLAWHFESLDPDILKALSVFEIDPRAATLDLGCGTGIQSIALAELGYRVTATDISQTAVNIAADRAAQSEIPVTFLQDDILLSNLHFSYDLVIDRGVLHLLDFDEWETYREQLMRWLKPGSHFFLKVFGPDVPGKDEPHRLSPKTVITFFEKHLQLLTCSETIYYGTRIPLPQAFFYVFKKGL